MSYDKSLARFNVFIPLRGKYGIRVEPNSYDMATFTEELRNILVGKNQSDSELWLIFRLLITNQIEWPAWEAYHKLVSRKYIELLDGKPLFNSIPPETQVRRKQLLIDYSNIGMQVSKSCYIPEGVGMPHFFEEAPAYTYLLWEFKEKSCVTDDLFAEYVLRSTLALRVVDSYDLPFNSGERIQLIESKIISKGNEIPFDAKLLLLTLREIRSLCTLLGKESGRTLMSARQELLDDYESGECAALEGAINKVRSWDGIYSINPPPGMTWLEFQGVRQKLRGMAAAIIDISRNVGLKDFPAEKRILIETA
ncbi:hypothetical protein [Sphaerotilus mobilis]|uniref:Uncharacterized protein n=1 Tax=Sphaerotilus mobilis TaxID=47994 RepID=A0A4Q7LUZ3_9BURK|nr:hypothetical protein [Sphaerotilus mobilis]RZS58431.1 hypothetical protein EV685_0724 [Sphaerotilus mobilis]